MSQPYLVQALEISLPRTQKRLLIALGDAADDLGLVQITHAELSRITGLHRYQFRYHLRQLGQAGLVNILLRGWGAKAWHYQLILREPTPHGDTP